MGQKKKWRNIKKHPRTYDSVIKSMSYEMRYTDGMFLERYYKAPRISVKQYEAEEKLWNSPWLRIQFESGKRYGSGDMNVNWRNIMSRDKNSITSYHPSGIKNYGLNEYKLDKLPNYGLIRDLYVSGEDKK